MPRISAEARGAAVWRAGAEPPKAPQRLNPQARAVWRDIVAAKPADWFDAGSLPLLEQYCGLIIQHRKIIEALDALDRLVAGIMADAAPGAAGDTADLMN